MTVQPKRSTTVAAGMNVTLTCDASGADNLKYQWIRMGKNTIPPKARGINSNTLIIPKIMIKDNGQYRCVVSSGDTSVTSRPGTVSVLSKLLQHQCIHTSTMHYYRDHHLHNFPSRCER